MANPNTREKLKQYALRTLGKPVIEINASTGGICSSEELDSKQAKVKASLGSLVYARASLLFDANASTGSTVRVYEKPKKTVTKTSFGGKIIMMK